MGTQRSTDVNAPDFALTKDVIERSGLRVWIDPDLCTGDGLCTEIDDDLFEMGDDGIACVKQDGVRLDHVDGEGIKVANVPLGSKRDHVRLVGEAADECPGECIFVELTEGPNGQTNVPLPLGSIESALNSVGR